MVVVDDDAKEQEGRVKGNRGMRNGKRAELTTPDLVILSLLAERAMHGYQVNLELERREVRDWAGISRPQVYYSLEKLAAANAVRSGCTILEFFRAVSTASRLSTSM